MTPVMHLPRNLRIFPCRYVMGSLRRLSSNLISKRSLDELDKRAPSASKSSDCYFKPVAHCGNPVSAAYCHYLSSNLGDAFISTEIRGLNFITAFLTVFDLRTQP